VPIVNFCWSRVHGTSVWRAVVRGHETTVAKKRSGAIVSTHRKFSSSDTDAPNSDGHRVMMVHVDTMCLRGCRKFR
jgi:hypothetical protein